MNDTYNYYYLNQIFYPFKCRLIGGKQLDLAL